MFFVDEYGLKYKVIKKKDEYYLLEKMFSTMNKKSYRIILKGLNNINTFIKNNKLRKIQKDYEFIYE